jgi:hypothetical protein
MRGCTCGFHVGIVHDDSFSVLPPINQPHNPFLSRWGTCMAFPCLSLTSEKPCREWISAWRNRIQTSGPPPFALTLRNTRFSRSIYFRHLQAVTQLHWWAPPPKGAPLSLRHLALTFMYAIAQVPSPGTFLRYVQGLFHA